MAGDAVSIRSKSLKYDRQDGRRMNSTVVGGDKLISRFLYDMRDAQADKRHRTMLRCGYACTQCPLRPPTSSYNMTSRALDRATDSALVLTGCDRAGSDGRRSTRDAASRWHDDVDWKTSVMDMSADFSTSDNRRLV